MALAAGTRLRSGIGQGQRPAGHLCGLSAGGGWMEGFAGLESLASKLQGRCAVTGPEEAAYLVRQVHIAIGCQHSCSHCFSNAPLRGPQMSLTGFARLASELGRACESVGRPFGFLFLGSMTDPSSVKDYSLYQDIWFEAMPDFSPVRIYTHGWLLREREQRLAFTEFLDSLVRHQVKLESVNVSIDPFSRAARQDLRAYGLNLAENLRQLSDSIGREKLVLDILYGPARVSAPTELTIGYWRSLLTNGLSEGELPDIAATLHSGLQGPEGEVGEFTSLVLGIGAAAGWSLEETLLRSRDDGIPMPFGRGRSLLKSVSDEVRREGLEAHRRKALVRMDSVDGEYVGLQIMPDGRSRWIDYDGYIQGPWLAGGAKVIGYL